MQFSVEVIDDFMVESVGNDFKIVKADSKINPIDSIFDFIISTYPVEEYPRVLEIAAGNGNFSQRLADYGYQVTAMDPKIKLNKDANYNMLQEYFDENTDISDYDLGIAIHPCGIHKDIISNFKINEKAMFLMPCFNLTCDDRELGIYGQNNEWLYYLESLNPKMKKKEFFKNVCFDLNRQSFSNAFYTK